MAPRNHYLQHCGKHRGNGEELFQTRKIVQGERLKPTSPCTVGLSRIGALHLTFKERFGPCFITPMARPQVHF